VPNLVEVAAEVLSGDETFISSAAGIPSRGRDGVVPTVRDLGPKGTSIGAAAAAVYRAEPLVRPELRIAATPASVYKAFARGLRRERVAARAGISPALADRLYRAATDAERREANYSGLGTKANLSDAARAASEESRTGRVTAPRVATPKRRRNA
jgi:hypothetical protein